MGLWRGPRGSKSKKSGALEDDFGFHFPILSCLKSIANGINLEDTFSNAFWMHLERVWDHFWNSFWRDKSLKPKGLILVKSSKKQQKTIYFQHLEHAFGQQRRSESVFREVDPFWKASFLVFKLFWGLILGPKSDQNRVGNRGKMWCINGGLVFDQIRIGGGWCGSGGRLFLGRNMMNKAV